jgi:hypothetical protein
MMQSMTSEQQDTLKRDLALVQELLALPGVKKHETRFEGEIALVSSTARFVEVSAVVERVLSGPVKSAKDRLPASLAGARVLDTMGGIRGDQTLYLKRLGGDLSLYVAYWPWGGGGQFTIKIGVLVGVPEL